MKIAIIHWTDSTLHGTGQINKTDPILKPMKAVTIGILVKKDKYGITVSTDYWGNDEYRNCETIYTKQIDYLQILEVKTKKEW